MHRFYIAGSAPDAGPLVLTGGVAHRIGRVLRIRPGETVHLFDATGREVVAEVASVQGDVRVQVTRVCPAEPSGPSIGLYPALIRPNRFELMIEKATELGASFIQPVITERCQVRAAEFGDARRTRWQRIAVEAAEQCGRRTIPLLAPPAPYAEALRDATGMRVLAWEQHRRGGPSLGALLRAARPRALAIMIGPEGGFTDDEVKMAWANQTVTCSLGPHILRAETAALATLAIAGDALASTA